MEFTSSIDEKMPFYSIHTHYFFAVLPRLFCRGIFSTVVALVFTAVLQIFPSGGRNVSARGKAEVLPQLDGSVVSGGTLHSTHIIPQELGSIFVLSNFDRIVFK